MRKPTPRTRKLKRQLASARPSTALLRSKPNAIGMQGEAKKCKRLTECYKKNQLMAQRPFSRAITSQSEIDSDRAAGRLLWFMFCAAKLMQGFECASACAKPK